MTLIHLSLKAEYIYLNLPFKRCALEADCSLKWEEKGIKAVRHTVSNLLRGALVFIPWRSFTS